MYNETVIQKLKQNNVSEDKEKTKQRIKKLWKSASKADRQAVMDLADVALVTVQRVYKTGSISAKLVVPLAQTFNINPFYFTGEVDEQDVCTEELLNEFLINCGYRELVMEHSPTIRKKRKIGKQEELAVQETLEYVEAGKEIYKDIEPQDNLRSEKISDTEAGENKIIEDSNEVIPEVPSISAETQEVADNLTEEEMILLLRAAILRSKSGGFNADFANKLRLLLLGIE